MWLDSTRSSEEMNASLAWCQGAEKGLTMNKDQAIRWLIDQRKTEVPLQEIVHHLKAALSFDPKAMALLHQITAEVNPPCPTRMQDLPPSRHTSRGFWRVTGQAGIEPAMAWPIAMHALIAATGEPVHAVRVFLDSRMGEQFARAMVAHARAGVGLGRAVRLATEDWMARPLDEIARLVYRLDDLPFLVGWIRIMQR